jgi:hypothetical protein
MFSPLAQAGGLFFFLLALQAPLWAVPDCRVVAGGAAASANLACLSTFQPFKERRMTWQTVVAQPSGLGESPFWHPDEQMLYWIDIPGRQIHRCNVFMGTV